jgi:class III poly(R)-hydroxyalkanoic acid synthase PhaE subunit
MRNAGGFGSGGPGGFGDPADLGAMAQQYWSALTDAMRSVGGAAEAQASRPHDPWRAAVDSWSQFAGGGPRNDASDAVERFSAQARQWLGAMQQVAGQFAGRNASAGDIASAWKGALGGGNVFAGLFDSLGGRGQSGFDQWYAQIAPLMTAFSGNAFSGNAMMGGLREEGLGWLRMPAFGLNREHQERWQALAEAQIDLQQRNDDYNALMLEAGKDAFERFERKLAERSEPGRQLQSARALFDLWIDAAEEAYAEIALSKRFRRLYGDLVNAQMRVRAGVQREIEHIGDLFGLPGRTEVDAAHRRIAELERQVRRLSAGHQAATTETPPRVAPVVDPSVAAPSAADRSAADKPKPRLSVVKPPALQSDAPKPAAAAKTAAKKTAAKKVALARTSSADASSARTSSARTSSANASPAKAPQAKAAGGKPSRATAKPAARRAPRQAIASIPMPEPLKPMPAIKAAKRTR